MATSPRIDSAIAAEIDRLATAVAKDPRSKEFLPSRMNTSKRACGRRPPRSSRTASKPILVS